MTRPRSLWVSGMVVLAAVAAAGTGVALTQHRGSGGVVARSAGRPKLAARRGGTIVEALPAQTGITWYFPLENGANASLYNAQLTSLLYKPLVYIDPNYSIGYAHSIARKITYSTQGTVYHVFLNPKWHWSNGRPVTTADVLFAWQVAKAASNPKAAQPWPWYGAGSGDVPQGISRVFANGPYEFTVVLKKPANQEWFIYNGLAGGAFTPLPKKLFDRYSGNMTKELAYLGNLATNPRADSVVDGPFKLASAVQNQSWTLVPNPGYSGHKASYARLVLAYETSSTAEFSALKTGQVQVGYLPPAEYGARAELSRDRLRPGYGFAYFDTELNFHPNAPRGMGKVFSQLYVRQALQMGVDQKGISKVIYHGFAAPQYGPIPMKPRTIFYDGALTGLDPFNVKRGKALLEAHGWRLKKGVMTKGSQKLAFTMMYSGGDQAATEAAEYMKQTWSQEGVQVTLKSEPFSTMIGLMSKPGDWQAATDQGIIYGGSYPSGGALFGYVNGVPGGLNDMGYDSPVEQRLIAATHTPWPNQKVNLQHFDAYEAFTARELLNLWTPNVATVVATAKNVHGAFRFGNYTTGFGLPEYWTVR